LSETIFGETPPEAVVPPIINESTIPPEVNEFVGEGKKYKSVDDALRSVPHSQKHIATLEEELQLARKELETRRTTEEILDQIKSGITPNETPQGSVLDKNTLAALVQQQLYQYDSIKAQKVNTDKVVSTFSSKYGEKAEEMYKKIAEESGLSIDSLNKLSSSSPNAVFKLAGLEVTKSTSSGVQHSTVNTEALLQGGPQELPSARIPRGATTKQVTQAWRNAGEKVKQNLS